MRQNLGDKTSDVLSYGAMHCSPLVTSRRLARLFGVLVREISNLMVILNKNQYGKLSPISETVAINHEVC